MESKAAWQADPAARECVLEKGWLKQVSPPVSLFPLVPGSRHLRRKPAPSLFLLSHIFQCCCLVNLCTLCPPDWHGQWKLSQACVLHYTGAACTFPYLGLNCCHPIPAPPSSDSPQAYPYLQTIFPNPEPELRRPSLELTMSLRLDVETLSITSPLLYV